MIRSFFVSLLMTLAFSSSVSGQWQLLKDFGPSLIDRHYSANATSGLVSPFVFRGVQCVHFLTREGAPNTGFVAVWVDTGRGLFHDDIWRTTDAGQTWSLVFEDSNSVNLIYNFSFENTLVGYASNTQGTVNDSILKTTNGGLSWFHFPAPKDLYDGYGMVYYDPINARLFLTSYDSLSLSTNQGISWTSIATSYDAYGMSIYNGSIAYHTGYFEDLLSTDGGLTWGTLNHTSNCWQPLVLPPSTLYEISTSAEIAQRSKDEGNTWVNMALPNIDIPTGDIEGSYSRLYVIGQKGVATSTDSGNSWTHLCGPTNDHYAIHFVRGDTMYTGDMFYNLWMNPTGKDSDIRYPLLGGGYTDPQTCAPVIAEFGLYNGNSCSVVTVTKFSIWGSNRFTLLSDTSKHHQAMGISDTLSFEYNPLGAGMDTEFIAVTYMVGTDVHVDTFYMYGIRYDQFTFTSSVQSQDAILTSACDSTVIVTSILNTCCDTLYATQVHLAFGGYFVTDTTSKRFLPDSTIQIRTVGKAVQAGTYYDTLIVTIIGDTGKQILRLPIHLQLPSVTVFNFPNLSVSRNVGCALQLDTTLTIQNFFCKNVTIDKIINTGPAILSLQDSVHDFTIPPNGIFNIPIDIRLDSAGGFTGLITVEYTVNGTLLLGQIPFSISLKAHPVVAVIVPTVSFIDSCDLKEFHLSIVDSSCDSIVITSIDATGEVSIDSLLSTPFAISSFGTFPLSLFPLEYTEGKYFGTISIDYMTHGAVYDTLISVQYSIARNVAPRVGISNTTIRMPSSTLCGSFDTTIYFTNTSCRVVQWSGYKFSPALPDYSIIDAPSFPIFLLSGQGDSITVHYAPQAAGTRSTVLNLNFSIGTKSLDTSILINGMVVSSTVQVPNTTTFDSISICSIGNGDFWITNLSCDSVELLNALAADSSIVILSPPPGTWIAPKDSVEIIFEVHPTAIGSYVSSITVSDSDQSGTRSSSVSVSGTFIPSTMDFAFTPHTVNDSISPCFLHTDTITIINNSGCDTLHITSATLSTSNSDIQLDVSDLPQTLKLGDSAKIFLTVNLSPSSSIEDTCIIFGDSVLSIPILASARTISDSLEISERSDTLKANICNNASGQFELLNTGCEPIAIDSIRWQNGSTAFSIASVPTIPFMLTTNAADTVQFLFDAEKVDTEQDALIVWSNATNNPDTVFITGIGYGSPDTMRLSVRIDGTKSVAAPFGSTVSLGIHSKDSVPPDRGLNTVSLQLHYDGDLLTAGSFVPSAQWSLVSQSEPTNGVLVLTLGYTNSNDAVSPQDDFGSLPCTVTVGKDSNTAITMDSITFNNGDSNYARCMLTAVNPGDTSYFTLDPFCGEYFIEAALRDSLSVQSLSVTQEGDGIEVSFALADASKVTLNIFDEIGTKDAFFNADLQPGNYEVPFTLHREGVFFVELTAGSETYIRNVAILR